MEKTKEGKHTQKKNKSKKKKNIAPEYASQTYLPSNLNELDENLVVSGGNLL